MFYATKLRSTGSEILTAPYVSDHYLKTKIFKPTFRWLPGKYLPHVSKPVMTLAWF